MLLFGWGFIVWVELPAYLLFLDVEWRRLWLVNALGVIGTSFAIPVAAIPYFDSSLHPSASTASEIRV